MLYLKVSQGVSDQGRPYECLQDGICSYPSHYCLTGLQWCLDGDENILYQFDRKLPFGASKSPKNFQTLSAAVCRIMKSKYGCTFITFTIS